MKIKYEFVTGTVEIEVSAEMAELHKELNRLEYNNNQKETRRHTTLSNGIDECEWLSCDDYNPINIIEAEIEAARIRAAICRLTDKQKNLVKSIFIDEMKVKEYAELNGISSSAVSQQIRTIRKNLKKLL